MKICAIDVETGGLVAGVHPILSIGAQPNWHHRPFSAAVRPEKGEPIEAEAAAVNGYSEDEWIHARPLKDVLVEFVNWLEEGVGVGGVPRVAMVAHNAGFDRAFLEAAFRKAGLAYPLSRRWHCSQATLLAAQAAGIVSGARGASLDALAELCGESRYEGRHVAIVDAQICLTGYEWLLRQMRPSMARRVWRAIRGGAA